jgi:DNA repair protein RadD
MLQLRPYQEAAIDAVFNYWGKGGENPLIELATGTGKSLVQAKLAERLITDYTDMRILSVTHVKELIRQNYLELVGEWPFAPAGIYSAGLGRRETQSQILFCGIQSVHNKAKAIGHVDLVMVDEAHLIPRNADTRYGEFLGALAAINPDMRVMGLTATVYRTDSGRLDEGDVRLFDEVVYTYGVADGIADGFLAPLVSKATSTGFDLGDVGRRGGDYVAGALQAACDKDATTMAAVTEIVAMGENRKSWLAFCAGVEHAHHVAAEIRRRGITCGVVTGDTPDAERDKLIADHKSGAIRCLTNNSVLTTGYNNPGVDLLAMLRPTLSCGLYVQMAGRGTRCVGADIEASKRAGKANCLVLDFAGNVRKHGPVDAVQPRTPGKGDGEAPVKECPECHSLVHLSAKSCPDCGHEFVSEEKPKHESTAAALPVLSTGAPEWIDVTERKFNYHDKVGGTPSVRVEFFCGYVSHRSWWCPQHTGFAKTKCDREWKAHGGAEPAPKSVEEFLSRQDELKPTAQIQVRPNGRYFEVCGVKPSKEMAPPPKVTKSLMSAADWKHLEDEIPF